MSARQIAKGRHGYANVSIKLDLSGFEDFAARLLQSAEEMPELNKEFISEEFGVFVDKVVPLTPVDTGDLMNAYKESEVRQEGTTTEQDWSNEMDYASYVNYGTTRIAPIYFWERGMNHAEEQRPARYQEKFAKKFEGG